MSSEALVKREFRRMINEIIEDNGGEMRLSELYSYLRLKGFHHSDILKNLRLVGIIIDQVENTVSLAKPIQLTLNAMIF